MRQRLDQALVTRGLVATRSRARDAIVRGLVRVGDTIVLKASLQVSQADALRVDTVAAGTNYVSRGALKLLAGLNEWDFSAKGRVCVDIGSSTGGFTQVLLENGAKTIYAVDVGQSQLHDSLKNDPRVVSLEGQDSRTLDREIVPLPVTALVADVSFISLQKAIPAALALAEPGSWLIALIKPQFEAGGPNQVGKGGIVRQATDREAAVSRVTGWLADQPGWHVKGLIESPIAGGSGSIEYLVGAERRD
jgi:23S rRNA (cytidine1920-2'-O)/16S rRNA (cytidine1409-2'-O)-methyltransferase